MSSSSCCVMLNRLRYAQRRPDSRSCAPAPSGVRDTAAGARRNRARGRVGVHKRPRRRLAATLTARGFLERRPEAKPSASAPSSVAWASLATRSGDASSSWRARRWRGWPPLPGRPSTSRPRRRGSGERRPGGGARIVGVGSWTGRRTALHCTANGKVLLAFGGAVPPCQGRGVHTEQTITRALAAGARAPRCVAWTARRSRESSGGPSRRRRARSDAVTDAAAAALSLSGPSYRMPAWSACAELGVCCRDAADEIAGCLGGAVRLELASYPVERVDLDAAAAGSLRRSRMAGVGRRRRTARGARSADPRPRRRRAAREGGQSGVDVPRRARIASPGG